MLYHDQRCEKPVSPADMAKPVGTLGLRNGHQLFTDLGPAPSNVPALEEMRAPMGPDCTHSSAVRCSKCMAAWRAAVDSVTKDPEAYSDLEEPAEPEARFGTRDLGYIEYKEALKPRVKAEDPDPNVKCSIAKDAFASFNKWYPSTQFAWLYGTHEDDGTTKVEYFYVPTDASEKAMEAVALGLQWRIVGCLIGCPAGREVEAPLTAEELLNAARWQIAHGKRFVTVRASRAVNGSVSLDCFHASAQLAKLVKRGNRIEGPEGSDRIKMRIPAVIQHQDVYEVPTVYFVVAHPIVEHRSTLDFDFPATGTDPGALSAVLATRRDLPAHRQFADPNFLRAFATVFGEHEGRALASGVRVGDPNMDVSTYAMLINSIGGRW